MTDGFAGKIVVAASLQLALVAAGLQPALIIWHPANANSERYEDLKYYEREVERQFLSKQSLC